MNMKVTRVKTTQMTFYSFCDYTLNDNKSCRRRVQHQICYCNSAPKRSKTTLRSTMSNFASYIPITGFSLRNAFTILLIQLLTISNYLQMSRLSLLVDAIRIDSVEFPSHVLIGHPVRYLFFKTIFLFNHKSYKKTWNGFLIYVMLLLFYR